jgi:hypothetical protein
MPKDAAEQPGLGLVSSLSSLPDEAALYAQMSQLALECPLHRRSHTLNATGYLLDRSASNKRTAVFHHDDRQVLVLSYAAAKSCFAVPNGENARRKDELIKALGLSTKGAKFDDSSDARLPHCIRRHLDLLRLVRSKACYIGYDVHVTGHALGGLLALSLAIADDDGSISSGHIFSPGAAFLGLTRRWLRRLFKLQLVHGPRRFTERLHTIHQHHIVGDELGEACRCTGSLVTVYQPATAHTADLRTAHTADLRTLEHFLPCPPPSIAPDISIPTNATALLTEAAVGET